MRVSLYRPEPSPPPIRVPLYRSRVPNGFPSPADDYIERYLDLNEYLIKRPASTFIGVGEGDSMILAGILSGALLVVDRSVKEKHRDIVIARIDGEFTCKRYDEHKKMLCPENPAYRPIILKDGMECVIIGVVMSVINVLCTR